MNKEHKVGTCFCVTRRHEQNWAIPLRTLSRRGNIRTEVQKVPKGAEVGRTLEDFEKEWDVRNNGFLEKAP